MTPVRHVAVIGAGPSGVYAAARLLKQPDVRVDIYDMAPVPFGLVRYGIAPDHIRMKAVTRALTKTLGDDRASFFGNVEIGRDVTVEELREAYDATIVATGARHGIRPDIPGTEDVSGCVTASDVVSWYNGRPGHDVFPLAGAQRVAVVGGGNVSLDVARVLLRPPTMETSDAPIGVITELERKPVSEVHIVVRSRAEAVKFTPAELMAFSELDVDIDVDVPPDTVEPDDPRARQSLATLREWSRRSRAGRDRRLVFHFRWEPAGIVAHDKAVSGLTLGRPAGGNAEQRVLDVQAVVFAIGHRGRSVPGVPFDEGRGLIVHEKGRVADALYATGWAAFGPQGVVGVNKGHGETVAQTVIDDLATTVAVGSVAREALVGALRERCHVVDWQGWNAIDTFEVAEGLPRSRPREKVVEHDRFLAIAARTQELSTIERS